MTALDDGCLLVCGGIDMSGLTLFETMHRCLGACLLGADVQCVIGTCIIGMCVIGIVRQRVMTYDRGGDDM